MSRKEKLLLWFLVGITSVYKCYFLQKIHLHIDEITTYLFFVKRGWAVIVSYYPNPNNHILYSLLAWLATFFTSNVFYAMKVPSLFISVVSCIILLLYFKHKFSFIAAIWGTLACQFSIHYFYYAVMGRGYVLMTFFVIICTSMTFEINTTPKNKSYWILYVLSAIAGFYAMVSFLYPFVALSVFLFIQLILRKKELIRIFIIAHLSVVVGVLIVYTPVFLLSGLSSITSNTWIVVLPYPNFFKQLPHFIEGIFIHILDIDYSLTIGGG